MLRDEVNVRGGRESGMIRYSRRIMNKTASASPTPVSVRVGTPNYARLRAQSSGFQFAGTLVTRFFPTVELARAVK
jgi:hypothetical protein